MMLDEEDPIEPISGKSFFVEVVMGMGADMLVTEMSDVRLPIVRLPIEAGVLE
jgi:hypothetical protein